MSADGSVEVQVKAEGVDEAAADLGGDGDGGGGMPTGGGGAGLSTAIKGGIIGGLLSEVLGPLLDVLDPILKVLQAFLAPLAALLMRLLSPVLRFLIQLLPAWMDFVNDLPGLVDAAIEWIASLPGAIWDFMTDLPGMIWDAIVEGAGWLGNTIQEIASALGSAVWDAFTGGAALTVQLLENIGDTLLPGDEFIPPEGEGAGVDLPTAPGIAGLQQMNGVTKEDLREVFQESLLVRLAVEGDFAQFIEAAEANPNIDVVGGSG